MVLLYIINRYHGPESLPYSKKQLKFAQREALCPWYYKKKHGNNMKL